MAAEMMHYLTSMVPKFVLHLDDFIVAAINVIIVNFAILGNVSTVLLLVSPPRLSLRRSVWRRSFIMSRKMLRSRWR